MLKNFKEIYNQELESTEGNWLEHDILDMTRIKVFVYRVCKRCVEDELKDISQPTSPSDLKQKTINKYIAHSKKLDW